MEYHNNNHNVMVFIVSWSFHLQHHANTRPNNVQYQLTLLLFAGKQLTDFQQKDNDRYAKAKHSKIVSI